jgi:pyruvate,water dikinase
MPYDRQLYEFDENKDLDPKNYKAWVLGTQWYPPPWCPLFVDRHHCYGKYGMQYGPEKLSDPKTKGWDWRVYKGATYMTVILPTEEESRQREPVWREKMRKVLEDPWAFWEKHKAELRERFDQMLSVNLSELSDIDLSDYFMEVWHFNKRIEEIHFYPMYALGSGNIQFRRLLKQLCNINPEDVEYSVLNRGFSNELTEVTEGLAEVAALAIELGLEDIFKDSKPEELLSKIEMTDRGKKWIAKFNEMLDKFGWWRRRGLEINTPCWWEDKTLPLIEIQRYVQEGKVTSANIEKRSDLVRQRKELEQKLLSQVPAGEREVFKRLMVCSQASHVYSEEHTKYVEGIGYTLNRLAALELGRRFVKRGMIDDAEDVLFLNHDEIFHPGIIQERCDLRRLVEKRKQEYAGYRKFEGTLPLFLGDPSKIPELIAADVIFSVVTAPPIATPEEVGAALVGCAGAPGVVEGIACVVRGEEDMDKVIPGSILVAPATTASWTPVFNIIKGVVTDGGGYLTHALIVGREFGIPAVVGTQEATRKLKTGQRVKVDGNLCRVYILD